jgi:hypothetical protein
MENILLWTFLYFSFIRDGFVYVSIWILLSLSHTLSLSFVAILKLLEDNKKKSRNAVQCFLPSCVCSFLKYLQLQDKEVAIYIGPIQDER